MLELRSLTEDLDQGVRDKEILESLGTIRLELWCESMVVRLVGKNPHSSITWAWGRSVKSQRRQVSRSAETLTQLVQC